MSARSPWSEKTTGHCSCCSSLAGPPKLSLDTNWLLQSCPLPAQPPPSSTLRKNDPARKKTEKPKQAAKPTPGARTAIRSNTTPQGLLGTLPPELLQQILEPLLLEGLFSSAGCATQFFYGRRANKHIQIVHQMIPLPQRHGKSDIPATTVPGAKGLSLAQTSRFWRDYIYSRLYGQNNAFVFNMGINTHEVLLGSRDYRPWQSWVRALAPPPSSDGETPPPFGPLTGHALKWLRDVTLVIACPVSHGAREVARLEAEVRRAVEMLRQCERLDSLQLCLQVCERADKRYDTLKISLLDVSLAAEGEIESGRTYDGGRRRMTVHIRDPVVQEPTRLNKLQRAFEPLLKLEDVARKVDIYGLMTREFHDELSRALTIGGGSGLGPEKLISAQGERIATGRNALRHGHIPHP
ncbi:hypothetical protein PG993_009634 [Apiospora rasikravindrae]|uniref:F-box domain-containing protein n=1 Tax=Apiospora rasikravindrae TaxID=990691 RepID=A0ABR1SLR0_9PEZI